MEINVGNIACFGQVDHADFCILTEPAISALVKFTDPMGKFATLNVIHVTSYYDIECFLKKNLHRKKAIIVAAPSIYFSSPGSHLLSNTTKLGILACFSTPSSPESIVHFLKQAENTDSVGQDLRAEDFFERAQTTSQLIFTDRKTQTRASFHHLDDNLQWHEQIGTLEWGQQQLLPSGEISTLPVNVFGQNIDTQLQFDGVLTIEGSVVLHGGSVSYQKNDQLRIYEAMKQIEEWPIFIQFDNGRISDIWSDKADHSAIDIFNAMREIDSRYSTLLEIGFGINTDLSLYPANSAMNEVYGGSNGVVHFGFGLIPFTQFHVDFLCPNTVVTNTDGETIFGN